MVDTNTPTPSALSQAAIDRRAQRASALEAATAALAAYDAATSDGTDVDVDAATAAVQPMRDSLALVVEAFAPRGRQSKGPRVTLDKAGFQEVADYFVGTGLTRKELASAAGVSTSVIATVQNEKGDRWSRSTFETKRGLIDQWMIDHAAEIQTRQAADLAAAAARDAKATAKAARATAASAKPAPKAQAKAQGTAKTATAKAAGTAKAGRPSPARRQANRKTEPEAAVATA